MAIDAERFADVSDLVRESYLERVPDVICILHHFRGFDVRANQRSVQVPIKASEEITSSSIRLADDGFRRIVVVVNRGPFAQELGVVADAEVDSSSFA